LARSDPLSTGFDWAPPDAEAEEEGAAGGGAARAAAGRVLSRVEYAQGAYTSFTRQGR
jgi:hypothetical protein